MFEKILIANRGEIALRILRAARNWASPRSPSIPPPIPRPCTSSWRTNSVCIGPPAARESYLNIPAMLAACEITGAEAVHPGYGFLSENAKFAEILSDHGIAFIGPTAEHIRIMGDKIEAKRTVTRAGHPLRAGLRRRRDRRRRGASKIASRNRLSRAGQGGGGRRRARHEGRAHGESTSRGAFGRPRRKPRRRSATTPSISKNIWKSRAISKSRFSATAAATRVHIGERDCSLQRRHQKVLEETPSPALNQDERNRIGEICADAMRKLCYSAPAPSNSSTRTASSISSK